VVKCSFKEGFKAKKFYAAVLDDNNGKWFLTDAGIVSGDLFSDLDHMNLMIVNGRLYDVFSENHKVPSEYLKNFVYELSDNGPGLWISTPQGAVTASLPEDSGITNAAIYNTSNSSILSNNVLSAAVGRNQLRWFGTDKGISALYNKKWLTPAYQEIYPESLFKYYPITAMATTANGDSLYVATEGAGVTRVFRNQVDAISGASSYLQWGPIEIPSDTVYSLCITGDGTQWIGTNKGVARHTGYNTLENWTVLNTGNGLVDNIVQAIAAEPYGNNVWFGTKGGVSVFDGTELTSFTMKDGLISNNILFIMIDKNGIVYLGADNGIMVYTDGQLVCYE
jgi:ligand-binding sensor domain-containing protein